MKIGSISGLIYRVKDLDKTVEFYESLGFRIGKREDDQATCYVNWFWLTFTTAGDPAPAPEHLPVLHMKVDNIDDYYGAVLAQGYAPETEPRKKQPSGRREFLLRDPDGYPLMFFTK